MTYARKHSATKILGVVATFFALLLTVATVSPAAAQTGCTPVIYLDNIEFSSDGVDITFSWESDTDVHVLVEIVDAWGNVLGSLFDNQQDGNGGMSMSIPADYFSGGPGTHQIYIHITNECGPSFGSFQGMHIEDEPDPGPMPNPAELPRTKSLRAIR